MELPVCLKVKLAPCWYAIPLSITSTAVIIPLADLASALITALSPIGLVLESSYKFNIVPPAPEVAPSKVPLSLNHKLNVSLLNPTSPVPSPLLVNLYTWPFDTAESDIEPLLATVVNTFVSLFNELADAIDIAWKLQAMLEGWGGEKLLESYFDERHPIGVRNTSEAADCFDQLYSVMQFGDILDEESD